MMQSTTLASLERDEGPLEHPAVRVDDTVDIWPVVAAREFFYGPPNYISVDGGTENGPGFTSAVSEVGNTISVTMLGCPDLSEIVTSSFVTGVFSDGYVSVSGDILAIWPIHHASRDGKPGYEPLRHSDLSLYDENIIENFTFIN